MPVNESFFSNIYDELYDLLIKRAGNTNPKKIGGVSGLTPFVRVISGVNEGLVLESIVSGDSFERRYGTNDGPGVVGKKFDGSDLKVFGRGLRPSPIVNTVSIDEKQNGIRLVEFSIKAFTEEQVNALTDHFLEPSFHILVEWGWNTVEGKSQILEIDDKTPCNMALYQRWQTIVSKREESNFQYDGVLGMVAGGGVTFGDDETYNITVKLTAIGSIAEYMETHRTSADTVSKDSQSSQIFSFEDIENTSSVGNRLFMIMVNNLPSDKQIPTVVGMKANKKWTDIANYINMDDEVVDYFHKQLSKAGDVSSRDKDEAKIPIDVPLLSKDRFIRLELAFEILNKYSIKLEPEDSGICDKKSMSKRISIENTVISGFPHMFSTDKSKLFIPNTKAPSFHFIESLGQIDNLEEAKKFIDFEHLDDNDNIQNLHPITEGSEYTDYTSRESKNGQKDGMSTPYAFPARYDLNEKWKAVNIVDKSYIPPKCDKYFWGWLKDLYINFDFFLSVIKKPNFIIRDVVYELLNGLSTSCNSLWDFQIVEAPLTTIEGEKPEDSFVADSDNDGDSYLTVVDRNFTGNVEPSEIIKTFNARGVDSPFTNIDFSINMSGDMMSSVVQSNMKGNNGGNVEGVNSHHYKQSISGDLSKDKVGAILQGYVKSSNGGASSSVGVLRNNSGGSSVGVLQNEFQQNDPLSIAFSDSTEVQTTLTDLNNSKSEISTMTPEEKRKTIYEIFTQNAGVFLKIQDREKMDDITILTGMMDWILTGDKVNIENVLFAGTWDDTLALHKVYVIDMGLHKNIPGYEGRSYKDALRYNPPFGLATVNFTVLGVSGFKPFDQFKLEGIPNKYSNGVYQITGIQHSIGDNGWETTVESQFRIIQ